MKKIFIISLLSLTSLMGVAQSSELKAALAQVNQILKDYSLGTSEYPPYEFSRDMAKYYKYKVIRFSFDYPNLIFDYTIVNLQGGWSSSIKDGVYSVSIPVNSTIEYPEVSMSWGNKYESYTSVCFKNEEGITKKTNGKASLVTSFSILGDSKLTTEKFARELKKLQTLLRTENYRGKLGGTSSTTKQGSRSNTRTTTPTKPKSQSSKSGKYVQ